MVGRDRYPSTQRTYCCPQAMGIWAQHLFFLRRAGSFFGSMPDRREKLPLWFLVWAFVKSVIQLSVSGCSLLFIYQSNFFIPNHYNGLVWPKESLRWLYLPQAFFEVFDLMAELLMLRRQKTAKHLPWVYSEGITYLLTFGLHHSPPCFRCVWVLYLLGSRKPGSRLCGFGGSSTILPNYWASVHYLSLIHI